METNMLAKGVHLQEEGAHETNTLEVEHSHSSPINIIEWPEISDPVFKHIAETFTTHELVQQSCVSKAWKSLLTDNMLATVNSSCSYTKASLYFPIRFYPISQSMAGGQQVHTWTWSGVHQPSGITHTLPDIHFHIRDTLPIPGALQSSTSQLVCLALSGPLMLFGDVTRDWIPLVVYNPLTGESRELPKVDTSDQSPHVVDMVVDETTLSYKVILISRARVCTYTSSSNSWSERRFSELVTWGLEGAARVVVGGKLHFAELEIDGQVVHNSQITQTRGHVRVFKVDEEAGTWEQSILVALQDYLPENEFTANAIAVVECMDRLFALIPAFLEVDKTVTREILEADKVPEQAGVQTFMAYGYLALQFYVLSLDGAGVVGHIRMRIPYSRNGRGMNTFMNRLRLSMRSIFGLPPEGFTFSAMQCSARGSIIYVTYGDFLLQFDLLSGGSHTSILRFSFPDCPNTLFNRPHMAYSPSFHMKP